MSIIDNEPDLVASTGKVLKVTGLLLVLLGAVGIFIPEVLSLTIEFFLGWLMIMAGIIWIYYSYQFHSDSLIGWLKPLILLIGGMLLLIYPTSGIAALTLLLSFFLFTTAFGSFGIAYEYHPGNGWVWMALNGVLSLVLALLILIGWPMSSPLYLGIFVGISLLFDGLSLLMLGLAIKNV